MLNPFSDVQWNPDRAGKRKFACSLLIGFPVIAALFLIAGWLLRGVFPLAWVRIGIGGALAGAIFWLLPAVAGPFYRIWYFVACCIGFVIGNSLFALIYFLVVTPVSALRRVLGRPPILKGFQPNRPTYWEEVEKDVPARRYFQQF